MGDNNARCHNTQRVTVVEGEGSVSVINWEPRAIILQVDSTSGVLVNVKQFNYPTGSHILMMIGPLWIYSLQSLKDSEASTCSLASIVYH